MGSFRYQLLADDGSDLGVFVGGPGPWWEGDVLFDEGRAKWRITAIPDVDLDDDLDEEVAGRWVVEPV